MNVSTWNGATGAWRHAANWSNGVPDAATQADFTAAGAYTVTLARSDAFSAAAVEFDSAGATLALRGSLTLGGVFDLKAGTLVLSPSGMMHGGALMMDGGTLISRGAGGTLDGVQLGGALDLNGRETLNITGGLTGMGMGATIDLRGANVSLNLVGDQSFDKATLLVDSKGFGNVNVTGTLTLGPQATLHAAASFTNLTGSRVINDGSIVSAAKSQYDQFDVTLTGGFVNNGSFTTTSLGHSSITAAEVVNGAAGTLRVGDFAAVIIQGGFDNRGAVTIAANGDLEISSDTSIVNSGTIAVSSGFLSFGQAKGPGAVAFANSGKITVGSLGGLQLAMDFTIASLGDVEDQGALEIAGTLDNTGHVLRLGTSSLFSHAATYVANGGLITGGTVVLGQANFSFFGGGLADVTFAGAIDLSQRGEAIDLGEGVTLTGADGTGPGLVNLTGQGAELTFLAGAGGANALDNVTIDAGFAHGSVYIDVGEPLGHTAVTLTLGARANIVSATAKSQVYVQTAFGSGSLLVNAGQIDATASGGVFDIETALTVENDGGIRVANSDSFLLTGALQGSGQVTLASGGIAELAQAAASQTVVFADATGSLKLSAAASFAATLSGAVAGDTVDLLDTAATAASVNASDQLVVTDNGVTVATLQLAGDYSRTVFKVANDGAGGSLITLANGGSARGLASAMAMFGAGPASDGGTVIDGARAAPAPRLASPGQL